MVVAAFKKSWRPPVVFYSFAEKAWMVALYVASRGFANPSTYGYFPVLVVDAFVSIWTIGYWIEQRSMFPDPEIEPRSVLPGSESRQQIVLPDPKQVASGQDAGADLCVCPRGLAPGPNAQEIAAHALRQRSRARSRSVSGTENRTIKILHTLGYADPNDWCAPISVLPDWLPL
jgi:hypothetical protein